MLYALCALALLRQAHAKMLPGPEYVPPSPIATTLDIIIGLLGVLIVVEACVLGYLEYRARQGVQFGPKGQPTKSTAMGPWTEEPESIQYQQSRDVPAAPQQPPSRVAEPASGPHVPPPPSGLFAPRPAGLPKSPEAREWLRIGHDTPRHDRMEVPGAPSEISLSQNDNESVVSALPWLAPPSPPQERQMSRRLGEYAPSDGGMSQTDSESVVSQIPGLAPPKPASKRRSVLPYYRDDVSDGNSDAGMSQLGNESDTSQLPGLAPVQYRRKPLESVPEEETGEHDTGHENRQRPYPSSDSRSDRSRGYDRQRRYRDRRSIVPKNGGPAAQRDHHTDRNGLLRPPPQGSRPKEQTPPKSTGQAQGQAFSRSQLEVPKTAPRRHPPPIVTSHNAPITPTLVITPTDDDLR